MNLSLFLRSLFDNGRVSVGPLGEISEVELREADEVLTEFAAAYRLEVPGTPPTLELAAARWGAVQFYQACQLALFRDAGEDEMAARLSIEPPPRTDAPQHCEATDDMYAAQVHYAVDLTFRFLPDLERFARSKAAADPLVAQIAAWAHRWPLSSVGMAGVADVDVTPLLTSPSLAQLYVDRMIARGDVARLACEPVAQRTQAGLGAFPQLAPPFAAALKQLSPGSSND